MPVAGILERRLGKDTQGGGHGMVEAETGVAHL